LMNLRYVLDEVGLLLDNLSAKRVLITADHGHALGERFLYDHEPSVHHPVVRRVPTVITTAKDKRTISPNPPDLNRTVGYDREQRLKDLGYL